MYPYPNAPMVAAGTASDAIFPGRASKEVINAC